MTLQQILYFKEIATTQNFTIAAQNLYVSQSSISHAIQTLERELGAPLFIRKSGKKVQLTDYGETFLPYAEGIMDNMDNGLKAIKQLCNPTSGVVNIVYSFTNCFSLVSRIFSEFYQTHNYNDISIRFTINNGTSLIEQDVVTGKQDLVFSCTPKFDHLHSVPIVKQELFLLVPAIHPLANAEKLSLFDVKDELFIGFYQNWNLSNWIAGMFEQCGLRQNVMEYFQDWSTQLTYVASGLGMAISPKVTVDPSLVSLIPIDHPGRFRDIYIHWSQTRPLSPSAKYVKDYCLEYLKNKDITF